MLSVSLRHLVFMFYLSVQFIIYWWMLPTAHFFLFHSFSSPSDVSFISAQEAVVNLYVANISIELASDGVDFGQHIVLFCILRWSGPWPTYCSLFCIGSTCFHHMFTSHWISSPVNSPLSPITILLYQQYFSLVCSVWGCSLWNVTSCLVLYQAVQDTWLW